MLVSAGWLFCLTLRRRINTTTPIMTTNSNATLGNTSDNMFDFLGIDGATLLTCSVAFTVTGMAVCKGSTVVFVTAGAVLFWGVGPLLG